jgi:S-adenosylmethionine/arginine decarboxylase-like enzyme
MYGVDQVICNDIGYCHDVLVSLVSFLGMNQQSPPFIFRTPEGFNPEMEGLSGWIPLIESGISIHTLTRKGFVSIDLYTCGRLDEDSAKSYLCDKFKPTHFESQVLVRGSQYYSDEPEVMQKTRSCINPKSQRTDIFTDF